jgi:hypothetical protein
VATELISNKGPDGEPVTYEDGTIASGIRIIAYHTGGENASDGDTYTTTTDSNGEYAFTDSAQFGSAYGSVETIPADAEEIIFDYEFDDDGKTLYQDERFVRLLVDGQGGTVLWRKNFTDTNVSVSESGVKVDVSGQGEFTLTWNVDDGTGTISPP